MTIEEHIRVAEFHITEAYALMKRGGKARQIALVATTFRRISVMMLNIVGLCLDINGLAPKP